MTDSPHGARAAGDGAALPPRPQYGEYATSEEQRARIRSPDASLALDSGVSPAQAARPLARTATTTSTAQRTRPAGTRSSADRVVTVGLLAYGLVNVVLSAIALVDLPGVATTTMQTMGIPGDFTNVAQGRLFGAIAAVALVVGWVVTAWFSWRRLRAGRITWWVPLVGAVVSYAVVYALVAPAILGDPAFLDYVTSTTTR